jgi:glyoxylase-like metal-dependent hydrolase (beta-lactamase superfamily II)/8-oxo-dGTP pyrophosphatase MutT (NUDIX family)
VTPGRPGRPAAKAIVDSTVVPRAASTVALLRPGPSGPKVLLTHRPSTMDFGPGLHVFPGGAVDPGDSDARLVARSALSPDACAAAWARDLVPAAAFAHHVAAIRELFEEAGVLLATTRAGAAPDPAAVEAARRSGLPFGELVEALDLVLRTDLLVPLSRWVTPPVGTGRRYDARFYVAALPDGAAVSPDAGEVVAHAWMTPRDALDAMAGRRIELWPPTSTTLAQLAPARGIEDVQRHLAPVAPATPPVVEPLGPDLVRIGLRGAGGIPGNDVNAYLVGRRRLVVVDPGDPNDAAVEAILAVAAERGARITAVILTSEAPDHAAGTTSVALRANVPVLAAAGAGRLLPDAIVALADGDLADLVDTRVRVHAMSAPHDDHVVFELPDAGAVLVGDLDGGGPSRAIPVAGDDAALGRSRERIRGLGPATWLPAHGRERREG